MINYKHFFLVIYWRSASSNPSIFIWLFDFVVEFHVSCILWVLSFWQLYDACMCRLYIFLELDVFIFNNSSGFLWSYLFIFFGGRHTWLCSGVTQGLLLTASWDQIGCLGQTWIDYVQGKHPTIVLLFQPTEAYSLLKYHILIFVLFCLPLKVNHCRYHWSQYLSHSLCFVDYISKSLIHLKLICVHGIR